jgi:hypothetical protein
MGALLVWTRAERVGVWLLDNKRYVPAAIFWRLFSKRRTDWKPETFLRQLTQNSEETSDG